MGSWGFLPLKNDAALDWLQQLFDEAGLVAYIEASLNLNLHKDPEDIRAAAFFVRTLVEVGLWPHHQRAKLINLAVLRLQQLLAERVFTKANFVSKIRHEIKALTELLPSLDKPTNRPFPDGLNL